LDACERAGDLQPLLLAIGQVARRPIACDRAAEALDEGAGVALHLALSFVRTALKRESSDLQ